MVSSKTIWQMPKHVSLSLSLFLSTGPFSDRMVLHISEMLHKQKARLVYGPVHIVLRSCTKFRDEDEREQTHPMTLATTRELNFIMRKSIISMFDSGIDDFEEFDCPL